MRFICGAIAEGNFDIGRVSSLGRAGVDKMGKMKPIACSSVISAKRIAIRTVANRLRFRRSNSGAWIKFKHLPSEVQDDLIEEVVNSVIWKNIDGISSTRNLDYSTFINASREVMF